MKVRKEVVGWIQNLVDKGILEYEESGGELAVTQGKNYDKAPQHFKNMFESDTL